MFLVKIKEVHSTMPSLRGHPFLSCQPPKGDPPMRFLGNHIIAAVGTAEVTPIT
jgi:hypothetical protein